MRTVIICAIAVAVLVVFIPGFARMQELKAKNRNLKKQVSEIKEENLALKRDIEKLQNDSVYLESVAREKMGVVRKGEVIYHIVPEEEE